MKRYTLILVLSVLLLGACGDEAQPTDENAAWLKATVPVRVLTADLLRGASAALYPDGRALVSVMALGGGTHWQGTWSEDAKLLTIRLHVLQEQTSDWSAPQTLDPPGELTLRSTGEGAWLGTRQALAPWAKGPLHWRLQGIERVPHKAVERDFETLTEHEFLERGGWEVVEDIEEQEVIPERAPDGK